MNLAAVHRDDVRDKKTSVTRMENVALACEEKGIEKIVFTSNVAVYGFAEPGTDESGAINPLNEYGRTKFEAEEKLREWQAKGSNLLTIDRPTVIFGVGNRGKVFNLPNQIALGKFLMAYIGTVVAFLESCIPTD